MKMSCKFHFSFWVAVGADGKIETRRRILLKVHGRHSTCKTLLYYHRFVFLGNAITGISFNLLEGTEFVPRDSKTNLGGCSRRYLSMYFFLVNSPPSKHSIISQLRQTNLPQITKYPRTKKQLQYYSSRSSHLLVWFALRPSKPASRDEEGERGDLSRICSKMGMSEYINLKEDSEWMADLRKGFAALFDARRDGLNDECSFDNYLLGVEPRYLQSHSV